MNDRALVLLSNDDGADAEGLRALAAALAALADLLVVVPDRERSGASHAISLARPLRVRRRDDDGFIVVDGTPVDCIYLGLLHFCARRPAAIVSGINRGYNLGMDVFYSGTVAAALEGAIRGVPAMAVSLAPEEPDFSTAVRFAVALLPALCDGALPSRSLLNVNVPAGRPAAFRLTRLGRRVYRDRVEERTDPRGRRYYWIGGPDLGHHDVEGSDCEAVEQSLISVTPLGLDLTDTRLLDGGIRVATDGFRGVV